MAFGYSCKSPLQVLSGDNVERIHEGTLEVLKDCGLKFESNEVLQILSDAGCQVDKKKMIAKFPAQVVEQCLSKTPDSFYLKGRNPKYDLKFGGNEVYFANHPAPQILDSSTNKPKVATLRDVRDLVTVIDALEDYHACFPPAMRLADKPLEVSRDWIQAEIFRNTEKSTMGSSLRGCPKWTIRMAEVVGERLVGVASSSSPLFCDRAMFDAINEYARAGHPVAILSGIAMGATGPVTLAGSLVSQNAEILAGLVITQLINPGLGTFYGSQTYPMDMRTGRLASGAVEIGIFNAATSQMARYYGLPCMSLYPMTDANTTDQQCGYEKAIQLTLSVLAGLSYTVSGGGVEDEELMSFEQLVIDNEMYGMMGRLLGGITVDVDLLAVDLIKEVGPIPGTFLSKTHTRDLWTKENYIPRLSNRLSHTKWEAGGFKSIVDLAGEKVKEILRTHRPVYLAEHVDRELDKILKAVEREKLGE